MRRFPSFPPVAHRLRTVVLLSVMAAMAAGCATTAPHQVQVPAGIPESIAEGPARELIPVVRYGRYTLIELVPEPAQRDLMRQVVEVVIPPNLDINVGDALRHVLRRSGYRLCDTADAAGLYALPLPAAHLHLGPLMLRDALLTLAGPAWDVSVDDGARQVCFRRHATPVPASANPSAAAAALPSDETHGAEGPEVQP